MCNALCPHYSITQRSSPALKGPCAPPVISPPLHHPQISLCSLDAGALPMGLEASPHSTAWAPGRGRTPGRRVLAISCGLLLGGGVASGALLMLLGKIIAAQLSDFAKLSNAKSKRQAVKTVGWRGRGSHVLREHLQGRHSALGPWGLPQHFCY